MCNPVALAVGSLVIGAAQGVVGYMGQQAQYKAQAEAYKQNAINASRAAEAAYASTDRRILQEGAAATQKKFEAGIKASRATATAENAAASGGVSGGSLEGLLRDLYGQRGRYNESVDANLQMSRAYLQGEKESIKASGQSQINSVPIPEVPSFLPTLVGIFGSGLDAYSAYRQQR